MHNSQQDRNGPVYKVPQAPCIQVYRLHQDFVKDYLSERYRNQSILSIHFHQKLDFKV